MDQLDSKVTFKPGNAATDGTVIDAQLPSGAGERSNLGDGEEVSQVLPVRYL